MSATSFQRAGEETGSGSDDCHIWVDGIWVFIVLFFELFSAFTVLNAEAWRGCREGDGKGVLQINKCHGCS